MEIPQARAMHNGIVRRADPKSIAWHAVAEPPAASMLSSQTSRMAWNRGPESEHGVCGSTRPRRSRATPLVSGVAAYAWKIRNARHPNDSIACSRPWYWPSTGVFMPGDKVHRWRALTALVPLPIILGLPGLVAQSVEQWTFNPLVEGSNPSRPTMQNKRLGHLQRRHFCFRRGSVFRHRHGCRDDRGLRGGTWTGAPYAPFLPYLSHTMGAGRYKTSLHRRGGAAHRQEGSTGHCQHGQAHHVPDSRLRTAAIFLAWAMRLAVCRRCRRPPPASHSSDGRCSAPESRRQHRYWCTGRAAFVR
jgi:hypothetical protein